MQCWRMKRWWIEILGPSGRLNQTIAKRTALSGRLNQSCTKRIIRSRMLGAVAIVKQTGIAQASACAYSEVPENQAIKFIFSRPLPPL